MRILEKIDRVITAPHCTILQCGNNRVTVTVMKLECSCFDHVGAEINTIKSIHWNSVGQSREILFEFGSTFATTLVLSEAYSTTELPAQSGDAKHQIICKPGARDRVPALFQNVTSRARSAASGTVACRSSKVTLHLIFCDA